MKTMLISGGSDGLGKALAEHFKEKYQVVILANNPEGTCKEAEDIGCDCIVADVSDYKQVETAVETLVKKYNSIDYLINCAGLWIEGNLEDNDPERIKNVMNVNALGTINLVHAILPHMKEKKSGRIVNVISQAGLYIKAERAVYNASKWAITGFTNSLALELVGSGVTVSGFYPGAMKTKLFEKAGIQKDTTKQMELSDAVRAVDFIIETPDGLTIPELGIKMANY